MYIMRAQRVKAIDFVKIIFIKKKHSFECLYRLINKSNAILLKHARLLSDNYSTLYLTVILHKQILRTRFERFLEIAYNLTNLSADNEVIWLVITPAKCIETS